VSHPPVLVLVVALFQELTEISEAFSEVLRWQIQVVSCDWARTGNKWGKQGRPTGCLVMWMLCSSFDILCHKYGNIYRSNDMWIDDVWRSGFSKSGVP
jgi:hypothetical protein